MHQQELQCSDKRRDFTFNRLSEKMSLLEFATPCKDTIKSSKLFVVKLFVHFDIWNTFYHGIEFASIKRYHQFCFMVVYKEAQILLWSLSLSCLYVNMICARSCKRSGTLVKSLLFWLAGKVSWPAEEVFSPCRK